MTMTCDYQELLTRDEWKTRRVSILDQTNHSCDKCGRNRYQRVIDVHHRYYRLDWLPWEYPDSAFVTLCREHHEEFHRTNKIPVFDSDGLPLGSRSTCDRCDGPGYIPVYRHVQDGICFRCWGSGIDFEKVFVGRTQAQMDGKLTQSLPPPEP